uniref:Uncharacterized protein n=1 Tax=Octopus bimaculoides TaxID=37653 RepID=A0A0L8HQV5_OCTBM
MKLPKSKKQPICCYITGQLKLKTKLHQTKILPQTTFKYIKKMDKKYTPKHTETF